MPKVASVIVLSETDRNQLDQWVRAQFTPQQVVLRSRILLLAAEGKQDLEIADELEVNRHTAALLRGQTIVWTERLRFGRVAACRGKPELNIREPSTM